MAAAATSAFPGCLIVLVAHLAGTATADTAPLTWEELRSGRPASCGEFLKSYFAEPDCAKRALMLGVLSQKFAQCSPGLEALDGQTVTIAGYAHPLEMEFYGVQEFLLIPKQPEACRHPPPPLPDQIIAVEFPDGLDINADPVWVSGILRVALGKSHLATSSYAMEATEIVPAVIPDVGEAN